MENFDGLFQSALIQLNNFYILFQISFLNYISLLVILLLMELSIIQNDRQYTLKIVSNFLFSFCHKS